MTQSADVSVLSYQDRHPKIASDVFLAAGARIIGDVEIGEQSSVWFNAVIRGDSGAVRIGERTNVQDNVSVHVAASHDALLGDGISIGHNAVVHGCTIEDDCLIGMGAVVLQGAHVGRASLIAAGSVVLEGAVIPPRSLVAGVPGKVRRALSDDEVASLRENAAAYLGYSAYHGDALAPGE